MFAREIGKKDCDITDRHSGESRNPVCKTSFEGGLKAWIPASAGMTFLLVSILIPNKLAFSVPKMIPVVSGQFTTGQWYFNNQKSSLAGNAYLQVVPAIRYNTSFSLIPSFSTNYRGTRSAQELAGGVTLFQDSWENVASVKGVHSLGANWKIRENAGAQIKWFRETVNETWGKGLYDYRIADVGAEAEYAPSKNFSAAMGYDFSLLKFPNYTSLESGQPTDNSREYAASNPLDQTIHLFTTRINAPIGYGIGLGIQGFYSPRLYQSQTVVDLTGLLTSTKRFDTNTGGTLIFDRTFKTSQTSTLYPQLFFGYSKNISNQNHYDAQQTTYIANFYGYEQKRVGGQFTFAFAPQKDGPLTFDAGYAISTRNYPDRVIQSASGAYLTDKLYINEQNINFGFGYPLTRNFRLRISSSFGISTSNNQYEAVYRYNYTNAIYQFGVSYDY